MPNFSDSLSGLNLDRSLSKEELLRAIRFMIAAEYEAVELYGKVHDATEDEKIKKAIMSIIDEEKVHAGEFLRMLSYLDPEEIKFYQEGAKETEDFLKTADYPDHPDSIIVTKKESLSGSEMAEKDVWSYYEGVKKYIIQELKDQNLFIRLKTKTGDIYIRHPFTGKGEFIRINNEKQFEEYHTGRIVEFHTTMPAMCPFYVIDFDAVEDWNKTKQITADIADGLNKLPEVKKVEIRYTGKRGFHILGWLKKVKPIDQAREDLKTWLKTTFGDRKDLVLGESPKGSKGSLGVSPMKLNGGQVAKWSLRITGLCCVEIPRSKLMTFKKTDASPDKVFKKLIGKKFVIMEKKTAAFRVIKAFMHQINREAGFKSPGVLSWKN